MAWKSDKIAVGHYSLTNVTLDVSGTALIKSLAYPSSDHMVTVSPDGSLGAKDITTFSANVYGLFGDGTYGDAVLDASTTLTKEMYYNNLTINSNVWLNTAGFIVRVFGTLTILSNGHIACDGEKGANGVAGPAGAVAGGAPYSTANLVFPFLGIPSKGGVGSYYGTNGSGWTAGAAGGTSDVSVLSITPYMIRSGSGGGGGGGVGGGAGTAATTGRSVYIKAGAGGTGKTAVYTSGSLWAGGGGGGAGGGVLIIYAKRINNAGSIHANGGDGGDGYNSGTGTGGGGGGGGGGCVILFYRNIVGSGIGTLSANAGAQGANGIGGSSATAGFTLSYKM